MTLQKMQTTYRQDKRHGAALPVRFAKALSVSAMAVLSIFAADIYAAPAADALPTGGQVAAGQATISQAGNSMNINQTSQRAVVNWNSFDVGSNATVNFNQPNANSATLNRVNSATPSMIDGAVNANGHVVFVNPNGVVFGKGAQVNAGGITATTMNIADAEFMAGGKQTYSGGTSGKVVNQGKIVANGVNGYIALMAPEVRNEGVMMATMSGANAIALVAGQKVTLSFDNNKLINVSVDASVINALIENKRLIKTNGGQIIIAANSASDLKASVINNTGVISASGIDTRGGKVVLTGGIVNQNGVVAANSKASSSTSTASDLVGGNVTISGEQINLGSTSKTVANGVHGGGQILVGTEVNPAQANSASASNKIASTVKVASGAVVDASATQKGNGGMVVIHSQNSTEIHGVISANGGAISGNAGVVQTSSNGHVVIGSTAQLNVTALNGQSGTWKLQAGQINVDQNTANAISATLNQGHVSLIATAQQGLNGDIQINADVVVQKILGAKNSTLRLTADGVIDVQGQISHLLDAPLTVEMVASEFNAQVNSIIAANDLTIHVTGSANVWGDLFGQGSHPFVNVLAGVFNLFGAISANNTNGQGGKVRVNANNIYLNSRSRIEANGQNGGEVILVASDTIEIQNAEIQTNGSNGRGGSISISGAQKTLLGSATISAVGLQQGGKILIGNDAKNGTLPFSVYTSLDAFTIINAGQINPNSLAGGFVETSGQTLGLLAAINAGRGGMWLLDPTNVTISSTASTGGTLAAAQGQATTSNFSTTDIQNAINAGTSVTIIASGTIAQTANLTFAPASGVSVSLTYNNRSGTGQSITLTGTTTNTGAGELTLNYLASGQIIINGAINSTGTGKVNVVAQTTFATNTLSTCASGTCANIYSGTSGSITTKGGYVVMDATGGTITGTAITPGSIQNAPIWLYAGINTTNTGGSGSGPGGDFSLASSTNLTNITAYQPYIAVFNIGGDANFQVRSSSNAGYGFIFSSLLTTSPITAYGNLNITSTGVTTSGYGLIYLTSALTSITGNITLTATSTNTTATNNPGVSSTVNGTITATAGSVTINSSSNASSAVVLAGAIKAGAGISINGTGSTATSIVTLGAMTLGSFYIPGTNSAANVISASAGTAGTLMGKLDAGSMIPVISGGSLSGSSIMSGGGSSITAASLLTSTASSANYLIGFSDGTYTKIVQVALTLSEGLVYATEVSSKYNSLQLATGSATNVLNNAGTNLISLWNGASGSGFVSGAGGLGVVTTQALATTSTAVGYAAANLTLAGTGFSSTNSGNIAVTANNTAAGSNTGITQTGAIAVNAIGASISFISNNLINQTGAISVVANTSSASPANIIYDTTAGNKASTITSGNLTIGAGTNASAINYIVRSAGSALSPGVIGSSTVALPGAITIDNTYGAASGTPASGYITSSNVTSLATTASAGVNIAGALTAAGLITLNGVSTGATSGNTGVITSAAIAGAGGVVISGIAGGTNGGVVLNTGTGSITSSAGNISIDATTLGASNLGFNGATAATITATLGSVSITGRAVAGTSVSQAGTITAKSGITIVGIASGAPATNVSLSAMTISTGGGNISVTANDVAASGNTGIYQVGTITGASGSSISFVSNGKINQTGAVALAANTSVTPANITYDTTAGNKLSTIVTGTLTIGAGASTSAINFIEKSAGSNINPAAIGTSTSVLPGYVLLDNTYGCTGTGCTPVSGFINASTPNSLVNFATTVAGVTVNALIYASGNITINGASNSNRGIDASSDITSTNGDVTINGATVATIGVYVTAGNTVTGNNITINGTSSAAPSWVTQIGGLKINGASVGGDIVVTGNVIGLPGANGGIYQIGNVTGANGSSISFISNNDINQGGALVLAANTSGAEAYIIYDTSTGNKTSSIITGTLTIATSTSSSAINYTVNSAGANINPGTLGTSTIVLPGSVTIDNTFGAASGSPTSGFITASNAGTLATPSTGVTINAAIYASGNIIVNAASNYYGIDYSVAIFSKNGDVNLNAGSGGATANRAVYNSAASTITGNNITIVGTTTATGYWTAQIGALTINSTAVGGSISVTGNVINSAAAAYGIYQIGAIAGASGSSMSFISNKRIDQNGTITLVPNTSGTAANITYSTATGNSTSTINTGAISLAAGSTAGINYSVLSAGAAITISGAVAVPGAITLDNTFGCSGANCTTFSGYLNKELTSWATLVTTSNGISVSAALRGTAITINGISSSGRSVLLGANLTATSGNINILGTSNTGPRSVTNNDGASWLTTAIAANSGAVNITGISTTTGDGVLLGPNSTISAKSITVIGSEVGGTYAVYLDALTIVAGGTNINVTGTVGTNTDTGIYQTGAIADNAAGSNISFITNGKINQTGQISLVANTGSTAVSVTYNTTSGTKDSSVISGALTIASGTNTSPINYIIKTAGAAINPSTIGTAALPLPGYVLLDNTYGCTGTGCTPVTGFINTTTANLGLLASASVGLTINGAIYATGNISANAVSTSNAIDYSVAITSTGGNVSLNGGVTTQRGVYNSTASTITANNITIIGTSSAAPVWDVQLGAMTINTASIGGSISVTGNYIGTPGALGGIYQIGTIAGASGSNISFISNNNIQQYGAITLVANTSGVAANITYDVTTGNKTSSILAAGALTIPAGSSAAINYIMKSAGSAINPAAIGTSTLALPGYVLIDNTYGCTGVGCTPTSGFINTTTANLTALATTSVGVTINNAVYATGNITVNAVSTSNAIDYSVAITSKNGNVILNGGTTTLRGVYNSAASTITANNITIIGTSIGAPTWATQIGALTINSTSIGGSISVTGNYIGTPGALGGIYQIGTITGASGSNISFISNNNISQNGALTLVANTSGTPANITYDVTTGIKTSSILTGALSIPAGSNAAINYIIKSAGSGINPAVIGTSTLPLPGYVLLDNTYGCNGAGCTPVSGFINTTTSNLATLATAGVGITLNSAIYASGNITVNGVTGGASNTGIDYSVAITSTTGNVILNGSATDGRAVYNSVASTITANNITINGTTTLAPAWALQIGALTINSGSVGGSITATGNVIGTPGAAGGIYQIGTITGVSGSNISFISNNDIDQNGAINLLVNTSGAIANVTFNTTAGNNTSKISAGVLTVAGSSTAAVNYLVKTNGAIISVPAITVPGYILLDNTCIGCATSATPTTAAANGAAITITGALSAGSLAGTTGVTINAVANGTGVGFTQGANAISAAAGGITITVNGQTGTAYSSTGNITATGQAINITTTTTTAAGISDTGTINGGVVTLTSTQSTSTATLAPIYNTGLITANSLTVTGNGGASTTIVTLGAITINAGGGNITVTANNAAAGTNTGITQTGAIIDNAIGSNISFISNNDIDQNGAITLVANNGTSAANITYSTTAGNSTSIIGTGTLSVTAGSSAAINYLVKSNGGIISVPAITVPGYILLDDTCLACATAATPTTAAANGAAITITGALSAGAFAGANGVTINAVANGSGIGFTQGANAISAAAGGVTITVNGQTGTAYSSTGNITATGQAITITTATTSAAGINDTGTINGGAVTLISAQSTSTATATPITATGLITANSLTVTGTGGASTTIVSLGAITINAGGTNIYVTANNAAAGSNTGITQTGAITDNAVGSNISFISNNLINQTGAIALVANTGVSPANIIYDTTAGNNTSKITTGVVTVAAGTSNAAINYLVKTNGAIISVPAITVPGYILLDNTCLACATRATPTTAFLNGAGITITGALSAGAFAGSNGVTINVVANGSGIGFTQGANAISAAAGGVTITVNSQTGTGYTSTGSLSAAGQAITITTTTTSGGTGIWLTGAVTGGAVTLISNKTSATATAVHIAATGLITANSLTVTTSGGLSATLVSLGAITINAGGGNITVNAMADTATTGTDVGIYQSGAITNNAVGSNISFITNNVINQIGAIALVSSTGAPAANVTYDTTSGTKAANISGGALIVTGTGSTINYIAKSAGSAITTGSIGASTAPLPGYVTLDNTYGCSTAPCTKTSGFVGIGNAATLATASAGVTIANAIYAVKYIAINGISNTASGVTYSAAINSSEGGIAFNGTSVGTATTSYGIYASAAAGVVTAAGLVEMYGTSTASTGTVDAIKTVATITGNAGVMIFGMNTSGNITLGALVKNAGTTRGVTVSGTGNVSLAGAWNSGVNGIIIVAGSGEQAGVITGGDITAVGTLTNTGGVISISMAKPDATSYAIAGALGITTANANATTNIAYGIAGGTPVQPGSYTGGNFINYRQKITSTLAISVTLNNNYSAVYGTAYNSNAANDWLQDPANATVTYTGSATATFGLSAPSLAYAKSVLVFSPTVGGSTAANGTNANAVQTGTTLTSSSLSATDGTTVTLSGTARTYTITPAVLGISVTAVYNGTTSLTSPVVVTTGLAAWDKITSVTVNSANANGASTYVTAIGGTSTVGSFSASNYLINSSNNGTLSSGSPVNGTQVTATNQVNITPAPLGVTINGVYNGSTTIAPTAFTVNGLVNGQTITGLSSATVNNINVSANNSNYVTAITTSGGTASMSNYSITAAYNTVAGKTQNTVTLTPKALTVTSVTIAAKTYDGTTSATVTGGVLVGLASVDTANVTLTQTASFVSANAANNVGLVMVGSIAGSASGNYTLTSPTGITANIARKAITVGGTSVAASKVYDGTTAATVSGGSLVGVIAADAANISLSQSGVFAIPNVGNAIAVAVSTSITGTAASNYVVTQPANLSANITPKTLTVVGTAVADKVYNGATLASVSGGSLVGLVTSDLANVSLVQAGTFSAANAGTAIPVTISDSITGSASSNYTLVQPTGITGKITPAPLGISVAAIYSGSTTIIPATFTVTGLVNNETITALSSVVLDNMNVSGNSTNFVRSISIGGGTALASNYAFNTVASSSAGNLLNTVTLTPKTLTVAGTLADKKSYDGTTSVNVWGGSLVGVIGVDVVNLKQAGVLNDANAGAVIPVTVTDSISGFSASNYTLIQPTGVTASVVPRVLTISDGTVANKVYDGTTNAVLTGGALVGVLPGDVANVILTQAGRFSSPNVSNGIIIIASGSISGSAASNYTLIQPSGITANITPAMLGISVLGVANGTNTITPLSFTISGLINGQTITGLSSVSVKSASISSNGSNFVTGIVISGGTALATNYAFSQAYDASASITQNTATLVNQNQKLLTVTGSTAVTKVYDGTTSIAITGGTLVGLTSGDVVNLVQSAVLINPNVSTSAGLVMNNSITGAAAGNYVLIQPSGITAIVTPAPLGITITGEYNGTTAITPTSFTTTGLVAGQTIAGLSSATVSNANVAGNGSNFVTAVVSSGGTALLSNYAITPSYNASAGNTKNTATITAKALTVGGISVANSKVYDGTTAATVDGGTLVGVIGADVVSLNQAGTFAQAGVGSAITVTATNSLAGASASNYSLVQPAGLTANITPKALTVAGLTVANKVYDGTTGAVATGGALVGVVSADSANVTLSQNATFASSNVGNGIYASSVASISGSASGNYTIVQPAAVTANITPKALTMTGTTVANKVYDGTTAATVTAGTLSGLISADAANVTLTRAGTFSSSNVANSIPVTMSNSISGSAAGNYTLTQPTGITGNITAKSLTITANDVSSTYGNAVSLGNTGFTQTGLLTGDAINTVSLLYNGTNAVPATLNAGSYSGAIVASAATGNGLSNYAITYQAGNLAVGQATLTLTPSNKSVVYNGNTLNASTFSSTAANYAVSGYQNTDSASNVTLSFTGSLGFTANGSAATILNAGSYGYSAGNLAITTTNANYRVVLSSVLTNQYVVTPATVSLSASKVFDGATSFTVGDVGTTLTVATGIGSQTLNVNGSANANSADVIGVSSLNTSGLTLADGTGLASNYVLPLSTGDVVITRKPISVSLANQTKVYDTNTSAILTAGNGSSDGSYLLTGFVGSDGAYITQTAASYNNANVASATTVTATVGTSYVAKGSTALSNYALPTSASTYVGGATITPAPLTMTADNASTYVGVAPTLTYQLTGLLGADTASSAISNPTVTYSAALLNAAVGSPTLNALTPIATSSNYSLQFVRGSLMVVDNYQMVVNAGSNTVSYGLVNSSNAGYLGNALTSSNHYVTAGYCTNCAVGNATPNIISLAITAPTAGSNVWIASDSLGTGSAQGKYQFEISPVISTGAYVAGGSLSVGNYVLNANNLSTVTGFTQRFTNPTIIYTAGNLSVTPKVLTVSNTVVANKTYDATTSASVSNGQLVGVAQGDQSNIALVQSGSFVSANAGNTIAVNIVDSLSGSVASNYVLTQPTGISANIVAAPVTISGLAVADKVYDGTNAAVVYGTPTVSGLLGSDAASVIGMISSGTFVNVNAANNIGVNLVLSGLSLNNSNYVIAGTTSNITANITPKTVTFTGTATKVYDGSTAISGVSVSTGVGAETLLLSNATANSANVGAGNFISAATLVNGTGANGGLASNYTLPALDLSSAPFNITKASLLVTADNKTMTYGAFLPVLSATITGFVHGETDALLTGTADLTTTATAYSGVAGSASVVGSYAITPALGTLAADNYSFTYANGSLAVGKANLIITASADSKVYGSTTTLAGVTYVNGVAAGTSMGYTNSALVNGDILSSVTLTSAGGNATANVLDGPFTITPSAATGSTRTNSSNYNISYIPATNALVVTPKEVTLTGTTATKVYDGTTALTGNQISLSGLVSGQTLTYTGATASSANVGSGNYITGLTLANGTGLASNYVLPTLSTTTAPVIITPKAVSIAGVKTYDATTGLTGSQVTITGLISTETLSYTAAAANDANVATANKYFSAITLADGTNGGLATNYALPSLVSASASNSVTINPLTVTLTGTTATKVYDGTTALTGNQISLSGLVSGQTLTYTGATASSANVGSGNYITGMTLADGTGLASNYALPTLNLANAPVDITKANLSAIGTKVYDGTVSFLGNHLTVTGVNGETFVASGEGVLNRKDVQVNQALLSVRGLVLTGVPGILLSNYNDLTAAQTSVSVTIKNITLSAPAITKVYDGGYTYTLNASDLAAMNAQLAGTDTFSAATAIYVGSNPNVGSNKAITLNSVMINDANNGANYNVAYINSTGAITPAPLLVTAANDAKFVSQVDNPAYAGVLYKGFVNGETSTSLGGTLTIARSNLSVNGVGTYAGVLQASGLTSNNYQISYAPGSYTIVAAENLLIRAVATTTYGTAPTYQFTAQYLAADNTTLSYIGFAGTSPSSQAINLSAAGNISGVATFTLNDGGSAADVAISPIGTSLSRSNNIKVGQYNVVDATPTFNVSSSFKGVTVVGQLTVNPMTITAPTLGANSISKVYDGNAVISANAINISSSSSQLLSGDLAAITATGTYADKNAANGKSVTVNFALNGVDATNYVMSATQVTGNYGQITQLNSVTYVGASGGNWSTASNWAGGAIPDYANVANVIIPTNRTVNFDSSVGGPMTSAIQNNGLLNINLSTDTTFANAISGAGALAISNVGVVTLSGNSTYSGGTTLNAGASLIAASDQAIGAGGITSNGTAANPAKFAISNGFVLPSLIITGGTTQLMSNINTVGAQSYTDLILGSTITLATTNADISLLGKVDSALNKANGLTINAGTANVTIADSIGSLARFNSLSATGRVIYILADVLTATTQEYNGAVLIGDVSLLGRTPVAGFLYTSHYTPYFEYQSGNHSSAINYLNRNPIYIRTLISEDPVVTFNGTVNDVLANTHTLLIAAISPAAPANNLAAINAAASINFNNSVGQDAPLYSLNAQTVLTGTQNNNSYLGAINLIGDVATYSSQTYRANIMTAQSNPQPGTVTFSVVDPAASVTYLLPIQDTTNSACAANCGQMNLQNPNSVDSLKINGDNNFYASRNSAGEGNWGARITQDHALGYIPLPPGPSANNDVDYTWSLRNDKYQREVKQLDRDSQKGATVDVGDAQVDGLAVDCAALRKDSKAVLPPECR